MPPITSIAAAGSTAARCRHESPTSSGRSIRTSSRSRKSSAPGRTHKVTRRELGRAARNGLGHGANAPSPRQPVRQRRLSRHPSCTHRTTTCRGRRASRAAASEWTWRLARTPAPVQRAPRHGVSRATSSGRAPQEHRARSPCRQPKVVLGDFNEWMKGLATSTLERTSPEHRPARAPSSTPHVPGVFPVLHLDHIYYEGRSKS
jgi:hypothetical protein